MLKKMLIAGCGEDAVSIHRACCELGIATVAIHAGTDVQSRVVQLADESVCVGTYPREGRMQHHLAALVSGALLTGADALHPGYGTLSENHDLAEICHDYGLTFVGPSYEAMRRLTNRVLMKRAMRRAGLLTVPGPVKAIRGFRDAGRIARQLGYPVIFSAKGARGRGSDTIARDRDELEKMYSEVDPTDPQTAKHGAVFLEKLIDPARKVHVQILCDDHGHGMQLGDAGCVMQGDRRLLVAEAPASCISAGQRKQVHHMALRAAEVCRFSGVGCVQFLLDENDRIYFDGIQPGLTEEYPMTEMLCGVDLPKEQIRIAAGLPLSFAAGDIQFRGHALACHIHGAAPDGNDATGTIDRYIAPSGPGTRVDTHVYSGWKQPAFYDPLLAKLTVWAECRTAAVDRMLRALGEMMIQGVNTTIPHHQKIVSRWATTQEHPATFAPAG